MKTKKDEQPEEQDQVSISGTEPEPESDDDTLQNVHDVGLYEDQDEEHPGALGIDQEVDKDQQL